MRVFAVLCLMLLHFPTAAQTPSAAAGFAERLAQARLAWELAEIADYVYGYNKFCECHAETPPETLVSVAGGVVQDVRHRMAKTGDVIPADRKNFALYWTIADLFALLERAASGTASVRADFDPELGVPQRIFIDYRPELIGDEVDVRVTHFNAR